MKKYLFVSKVRVGKGKRKVREKKKMNLTAFFDALK